MQLRKKLVWPAPRCCAQLLQLLHWRSVSRIQNTQSRTSILQYLQLICYLPCVLQVPLGYQLTFTDQLLQYNRTIPRRGDSASPKQAGKAKRPVGKACTTATWRRSARERDSEGAGRFSEACFLMPHAVSSSSCQRCIACSCACVQRSNSP